MDHNRQWGENGCETCILQSECNNIMCNNLNAREQESECILNQTCNNPRCHHHHPQLSSALCLISNDMKRKQYDLLSKYLIVFSKQIYIYSICIFTVRASLAGSEGSSQVWAEDKKFL